MVYAAITSNLSPRGGEVKPRTKACLKQAGLLFLGAKQPC